MIAQSFSYPLVQESQNRQKCNKDLSTTDSESLWSCIQSISHTSVWIIMVVILKQKFETVEDTESMNLSFLWCSECIFRLLYGPSSYNIFRWWDTDVYENFSFTISSVSPEFFLCIAPVHDYFNEWVTEILISTCLTSNTQCIHD